FVLWTGLSLAWSQDLRQGAISVLFFYVPFGFVALAVARLAPEQIWIRVIYGQLVLMAPAFAAIGVYQWAPRDIFLNPKVTGRRRRRRRLQACLCRAAPPEGQGAEERRVARPPGDRRRGDGPTWPRAARLAVGGRILGPAAPAVVRVAYRRRRPRRDRRAQPLLQRLLRGS